MGCISTKWWWFNREVDDQPVEEFLCFEFGWAPRSFFSENPRFSSRSVSWVRKAQGLGVPFAHPHSSSCSSHVTPLWFLDECWTRSSGPWRWRRRRSMGWATIGPQHGTQPLRCADATVHGTDRGGAGARGSVHETIVWSRLFRPGWYRRSWRTRRARSTSWQSGTRSCRWAPVFTSRSLGTTSLTGSRWSSPSRSSRTLATPVQGGTQRLLRLWLTLPFSRSAGRCSVTRQHPMWTWRSTMAMRFSSTGSSEASARTLTSRCSNSSWMSFSFAKLAKVSRGSLWLWPCSSAGGSQCWASSVAVEHTRSAPEAQLWLATLPARGLRCAFALAPQKTLWAMTQIASRWGSETQTTALISSALAHQCREPGSQFLTSLVQPWSRPSSQFVKTKPGSRGRSRRSSSLN